ncbi:hypothetical protein QP794_01025 [Paenibacillus sp. UMB7766-LJ446]|nr:hypothetical protein [Paenibacillus sp. UMB7766-LJ446]MDK8188663.1 hypothetical protein [Paenibacillus sp. UMB7766-LJ446]
MEEERGHGQSEKKYVLNEFERLYVLDALNTDIWKLKSRILMVFECL